MRPTVWALGVWLVLGFGVAGVQAQPAPDGQASTQASADADHPADVATGELRVHNTWYGATGGIHVVDAGSGLPGTFRLQLGIDAFGKPDYLYFGGKNTYVGGTFSFSWTVIEHLEVFASLASRSNLNTFGSPELLQSLGDSQLGAKGYVQVLPWLTVGGDLRLLLHNAIGDVGLNFGAVSAGLRGNATADLRQQVEFPLIARFGLEYLFDGTSNLIDDVEQERYDALGPGRLPFDDEDRHLLLRHERLAFDINRVDTLNLELGFEVPLRVVDRVFVHPLLEWRFGVPVNRQGYSCLRVPGDADNQSPDGCLEQQGVAAMPMTLTLGARVYPWVEGLAVTLGVDIGLTGRSTFVRELSPNRPWAFLFSLAYAVDARPRVASPPPPPPVAAPPAPPEPWARIHGQVVEQGTDVPIAGAQISYPGKSFTVQLTDAQGRFVSYRLPPGDVDLEVSHPEHGRETCAGFIDEATLNPPQEGRVELRCVLQAAPKLGALRGAVRSDAGAPLANARVLVSGPSTHDLRTDAEGRFELGELPPGSYEVVVRAAGHTAERGAWIVPAGEQIEAELTLPEAKKKPSLVRVTKRAVVIKRKIHFRQNSAELESESFELLDEVAAVLARNPQIRRVEVQGHTDNRGNAAVNRGLSQRRAEAVRQYLVGAGVEADRLQAHGYGDTRPLVPNLTASNRARNRRVQFIITKRAD